MVFLGCTFSNLDLSPIFYFDCDSTNLLNKLRIAYYILTNLNQKAGVLSTFLFTKSYI